MNKRESIRNERKKERFPYNQDILVDGITLFRSIDISEGGLYVYTGRSYMRGKVINVTLPLKHSKLTTKARVRHNQPGVGMGLMFIDLSPIEKAMIRELVAELGGKTKEIFPQKRKVLLAEKNELSRRVYRNKLFMDGFSVVEARDGMETLKLVREETPDLVVLDLNMEKIDGFKVLTILKTVPEWKHLPVIILSGECAKEVVGRAVQMGVDRFLHRMVTSPVQLAKAVEAALNGTDGKHGKGQQGVDFW